MKRALFPTFVASVMALVSLAACSSDTNGGLVSDGRVPVQHRPGDAACALPAAAGNCTSQSTANGSCTSDSQCSEGTNGRCLVAEYGVASTADPDCACAYDSCSGDSACAAGETCACHGAPYTSGAASACIVGDCRVDTDCGPSGYCSPSSAIGVCGDSLAGYYCHTSSDACIDDADCATSASGAGARCEYSTTAASWACVQVEICA